MEQMLHRLDAASSLIDGQDRSMRRFKCLSRNDERYTGCANTVHRNEHRRCVKIICCSNDDPVHTLLRNASKHLDESLFTVPEITQNHGHTARLSRARSSLGQRSVKWLTDIADEKSKHAGPPISKTARQSTRRILQIRSRLQHALTNLWRDSLRLIHHSGDRRPRHPRLVSNVQNVRRAAPACVCHLAMIASSRTDIETSWPMH